MARLTRILAHAVIVFTIAAFSSFADPAPTNKVVVRISGMPSKRANSPREIANYRVLERFQQLHPEIEIQGTTPLQIQNIGTEAADLMAIAGGTSPDILTVNFRQSDTYVRQGFLYPLDEYIEKMDPTERDDRIPGPVRPVVHREGPDGKKHYWMMPSQVGAKVLMYRRDLFAAAGLDPDSPPKDWEELRECARKVADPSRGVYAVAFSIGLQASWTMYTFLASSGASAMSQQPDGEWRATFDSDEAVNAYEFVTELLKEKVTKAGKEGQVSYRGADYDAKWADGKVAMRFNTLGGKELGDINPQLIGIAPIPKGPSGLASSEVNCSMSAIFAGQKDKRVRDAAWQYIWFMDSPEARKIWVQTMVEQGASRTMRPKFLRQFGFSELADLALPGLEEAYETALAQGTPEPYGKNCQFVYGYMTKPMEQAYYADFQGLTREQKRAKIKEYLRASVDEANERMIGLVPEPVRKKRNSSAWVVAVVVIISFILLLRQVFRWMTEGLPPSTEPTSNYKNRMAIALIAPALCLILMWQYWPLLRGSLMAFQEYSVMGGSPWVGINNFADVLFDATFWLALKNAIYFCVLWMVMGFLPPVCLAIILQEIPLGKLMFRILFYLPHLVSGVVIFFMWRGIYDQSPDGILNKLLGMIGLPAQKWLDEPAGLFNVVLGFFHIKPVPWLNEPSLAMFCVVFPLAWAHLGAGCIIYLAALKGIPDELYEAADIDGASFFQKVRYIVFSYLKPLLVINVIGAMTVGFKSADAILAMTGGGPSGTTQVIGYEIWQRSFMLLHFGQATAMAWILGVLLLSFTAYQLRILNKVEFRTTGK